MVGAFIEVSPPFGQRASIGYVVQENGCWEWVGNRNNKGYGMMQDGNGKRGAHRVLWERQNGPVPDGLELDHLCRNPLCAKQGEVSHF